MVSGADRTDDRPKEQPLETYSATVIEHARNPRNLGMLPKADGYAAVMGRCGDTMEIWLRVRDGRITEATFDTNGCGPNIATLSVLTELAKGKGIGEARDITPEYVLDRLGGLPEENIECAFLATAALKEAIRDYLAFKNEPWKRAYREKGR